VLGNKENNIQKGEAPVALLTKTKNVLAMQNGGGGIQIAKHEDTRLHPKGKSKYERERFSFCEMHSSPPYSRGAKKTKIQGLRSACQQERTGWKRFGAGITLSRGRLEEPHVDSKVTSLVQARLI